MKQLVKDWQKYMVYLSEENRRRRLNEIEVNKHMRKQAEEIGGYTHALIISPYREHLEEPTFENFMNWLVKQ